MRQLARKRSSSSLVFGPQARRRGSPDQLSQLDNLGPRRERDHRGIVLVLGPCQIGKSLLVGQGKARANSP